ISYLEAARGLGDRLIVAVNDDASVRSLKGASRPLIPLDQRMRILAALESVDWVVSFAESTPERLISRILPNTLVKGGDYQGGEIAGADAVRSAGGDVRVLNFEPGVSTSAIIDRAAAGRSAT
ncbi:MAG: adenylyltransferase/cytidyltransferase family protein, partial [Pseudomonadota bacterium]